VRQLENAVERAVALSAGREALDVADLPPEVQTLTQPAVTPFVDFPDDGLNMPAYLAAIEKDLIERALDRTRGNRNRAADLLGIKRTTLVEKLRRLGTE
jgi:two-component system, NtrC family, response regulator AtoC